MKILALETSTSEGGLAILEDHRVLFEHPFKTNENFGQNLFPLIDNIFKESKLTLKNIKLITVNTGPGSYTGLRVGVTCANTLSWVNQIPSIGVSNLFNMVFSTNLQGNIGALLYGNDKEAFFASYQKKNNEMNLISADEKIPWELAEEKCAACDHVIFFSAKKQQLPNFKNLIEWQPLVNLVGKSGLFLFQKQTEKTFGEIQPNYLRDFEVTPKAGVRDKGQGNRE